MRARHGASNEKRNDYTDVQGVAKEITLSVKTVEDFANEYESQRYNTLFYAGWRTVRDIVQWIVYNAMDSNLPYSTSW